MKLLTDIILNIINSTLFIYVLVFFYKAFCEPRINRIKYWGIIIPMVILFALNLIYIENRILRVFLGLLVAIVLSLGYSIKWYNRVLLGLSGEFDI